MFWLRHKEEKKQEADVSGRVAAEAEALYRSGKMHCAEAVLAAGVDNFKPEAGRGIVGLAAGFGGGSGVGCICGAVSGGTMAISLVLQGDKRRVKKLTRELHAWFGTEYGGTCCSTILKNHGKVCASLTGKVAGKVAEMLIQG